ncbi:MAG TPA: glycoside hydrolase family 2 TIM barrel-domain containing protein [Gemmatimonadaceae bacterium]|nr:glycoside hydrolase family 2 TIM barrel-domain containing protein [Gemmatimonadaceae bacterium]
MRSALLIVAASIAGTVAGAQSDTSARTPMVNPRGRMVTSLDGEWRTIVDPYETGYYNYRFRPDPNGWFRNRKPSSPTDLVEYDFDRSPTLVVPGDWNTQRPELMLYEGTIWYERRFEHSLAPGRRLFVYFGAANYETRVWVNGTELGMHVGGYSPFQFEITKLVHPGANDIVVKVDDRRRREGVPTVNADWWNYGGLTRGVLLVETPATFVREYSLALDPRDAKRVHGWVTLDGAAAGTSVIVRIPEAKLSRTITVAANGRGTIDFDAKRLARWSPTSPKLYDVQLIATDDTVRDRIGFRTIATRGNRILLNGKPVFLRGISMHDEALGEARRTRGAEDSRALLSLVKELGGNFVRLAHYPHPEETLRLADEMGLLVWGEIPVYWTIEFTNAVTLANARSQLAEMIGRDRNRASVVLWSVANETPRDTARGAGARLEFLRTLIDDVRALDDTRLVTAALEHRYTSPDTISIDDPLGAYLDVLGNNEYIGWYDQPLDKADRVVWRSAFDKPLVMSEFGGDAKYGLHGSADSIWTEEYQARLYERQLAMLRHIRSLAGMSPWILKDFRSPRRPLPGIQDWFNRKGLVSDRGDRKRAFFVLQREYRAMAARADSAR